ncbi:unnamed protein product, partial [Ectocarpus sp. 13 AM-2016]
MCVLVFFQRRGIDRARRLTNERRESCRRDEDANALSCHHAPPEGGAGGGSTAKSSLQIQSECVPRAENVNSDIVLHLHSMWARLAEKTRENRQMPGERGQQIGKENRGGSSGTPKLTSATSGVFDLLGRNPSLLGHVSQAASEQMI